MADKRKRKVVSMKVRLEALKRLDNGEPLIKIAKDIGVGETTVKDWKKNRKSLEEFCRKVISPSSIKRSTFRKSQLGRVDDVLWDWFLETEKTNCVVDGIMLQKKALEFNRQIGGDEKFTASLHWIKRWKERHGITLPQNTNVPSPIEPLAVETRSSSRQPPVMPVQPPTPPAAPEEIPNEMYNLHYQDFSHRIWGAFSSLLESKELVDVTLAADGKYIQAHKLVLSVCSEYFRELFRINPCKHPIVLLKDVDYESLKAVIQFMYCGEVQLTSNKLSNFLQIAEMLKVKGITNENNEMLIDTKKTVPIPASVVSYIPQSVPVVPYINPHSDIPTTPYIKEPFYMAPFTKQSSLPTPLNQPPETRKRDRTLHISEQNIPPTKTLSRPTDNTSYTPPTAKKPRKSIPPTSEIWDRPSTSKEVSVQQVQQEEHTSPSIDCWKVDVVEDDNGVEKREIKIKTESINEEEEYIYQIKQEVDLDDYGHRLEDVKSMT